MKVKRGSESLPLLRISRLTRSPCLSHRDRKGGKFISRLLSPPHHSLTGFNSPSSSDLDEPLLALQEQLPQPPRLQRRSVRSKGPSRPAVEREEFLVSIVSFVAHGLPVAVRLCVCVSAPRLPFLVLDISCSNLPHLRKKLCCPCVV